MQLLTIFMTYIIFDCGNVRFYIFGIYIYTDMLDICW